MARQVEARLLDSRVAYKMAIDHRSYDMMYNSNSVQLTKHARNIYEMKSVSHTH